METLTKIWSIIVQSNTFNFILMVIIIAIVFKLAKIGEMLDDMVKSTKESIENSTKARENALTELKEAQLQAQNVSSEVEEIFKNNDVAIEKNEKEIEDETQNRLSLLKENANKIIGAKEKEIASKLSKKTVLASIELAKQHVINLLEKDKSYHQKFIDESIKELYRLKQ